MKDLGGKIALVVSDIKLRNRDRLASWTQRDLGNGTFFLPPGREEN